MSDISHETPASESNLTRNALYKKEFWGKENLNYSRPHFRMEKISRIVNRLAGDGECTLLDVGCGPATLSSLLRSNIRYHGIDIAIQHAAPNLIESDFLQEPIRFGDKKFDVVVAQGVFEYVGEFQAAKFDDIARLLRPDGTFITSYVNFMHRKPEVYWPYSNVQPPGDFRRELARHFVIRRYFPTSHYWHHWEPTRRFIRDANMHINLNIPIISTALGVQYLYICSALKSA